MRRGATFNCAAKTNSSDYAQAFPHPVNNAGTNNNTDADSDGLIDVLDCNDASTSFLWPAAEVTNERVTGGPNAVISWASQAGTAGFGVTYDVVCGTIRHLNGFTDAFCMAPNISATSINDFGILPAGTGTYYLERAGSGAGCVGTFGTGGSPPTSRDATLATTANCP